MDNFLRNLFVSYFFGLVTAWAYIVLLIDGYPEFIKIEHSSSTIAQSFWYSFLFLVLFDNFVSLTLKKTTSYVFLYKFLIANVFLLIIGVSGSDLDFLITSYMEELISIIISLTLFTFLFIHGNIIPNHDAAPIVNGRMGMCLMTSKSIKGVLDKKKMKRKDGKIERVSKNGVCIHEAGHALFCSQTKYRDLIIELVLEIHRDENYSGYLSRRGISSEDRYYDELKADAMICLAGNAAEKSIFDDVLLGSDDDMKKWNAKVSRLIIHKNEHFIYTDNPTLLELEHNASVVMKFRNELESELIRFFILNRECLIELADMLAIKHVLTANDMNGVFDKIVWPEA